VPAIQVHHQGGRLSKRFYYVQAVFSQYIQPRQPYANLMFGTLCEYIRKNIKLIKDAIEAQL
jgi:hypothetical protein